MNNLVFACAAIAAAMAGGAGHAAPERPPLQLICLGGGTGKGVDVATVNSHGQVFGNVGATPISGYGSGSSTVMIPTREGFSDQVDVLLFAGDDKIRLPASIVPPIHGGNAGWYKLKNVQADARSIRANAGINFINHPKVYIDRITGTISISGRNGDYAGQCQVIDANAAPKF